MSDAPATTNTISGGGGGGRLGYTMTSNNININEEEEEQQRDERISARCNESSFATFTQEALSFPFAEGAFRWAAMGIYTDGARKGQHCVCKWFKDGHTDNDEFYDLDIKAMYKALELVELWNNEQFIDQLIKVNIPEVWVFGAGDEWAGLKALQEPFIEGYQKFNSNTGWNQPVDQPSASWSQVLQALSHFTYHISNEQFLLCDLQGGIYNNSVILTDPVILSRDKVYGKTDLGPKGISSFFSNHRCNQYCRRHWTVPRDRTRYHALRMGTSMAGGGDVGPVVAPAARATDNYGAPGRGGGGGRYTSNNTNNFFHRNNSSSNSSMLPPQVRKNSMGPPPVVSVNSSSTSSMMATTTTPRNNNYYDTNAGGFQQPPRRVPLVNDRNNYSRW